MITAEELSAVLDYEANEAPITTLYLSFDPEAKKQDQHKIKLKEMFRYKKDKSYFKNLSEEAQQSVENDFKQIEEYVNMDFDEDIASAKSMVIFSSSANNLWENRKFAVPMETSMVVNPHPYLRPLVEASSQHRNYAIILVDRNKARILEVDLDGTLELLNIEEADIPDQVREGGDKKGLTGGTGERQIERHINTHVKKHLKNVAEEAMKLQQENNFSWIYLGGRQEIINEFEKVLHSYVTEKVQGQLVVEPNATLDLVLERAREAEQKSVEQYEEQLIANLTEEVSRHAKGIAGMLGVMDAQQKGQIETLVVQEELSQKGYYCPECNYLSINEGEQCPLHEVELKRTPDIVDELIYQAMKQGASVEIVSQDMSDFNQVGAFLRFPVQK